MVNQSTDDAYTLIASDGALKKLIDTFIDTNVTTIALDIEGEYNFHIYGEHLCLIQINDGTGIYLIDTFKVDIKTIKRLLENRNILKIMYNSTWDTTLLWDNYQIEIKSILDLHPAVDLLQYEKKGLDTIISLELGETIEKKKKFQKYNWTRRPINPQALEYAASDVRYLFDLKETLLKKIHDRKLLDEYILLNMKMQNKIRPVKPKEKYTLVKGYRALRNHQKTVLKDVFEIRENYARKWNRPPSLLISKEKLIAIAKDPQTIESLQLPAKFDGGLRDGLIRELAVVQDRYSEQE